jgi:NADPH-dependent ferric siderophore reductase
MPQAQAFVNWLHAHLSAEGVQVTPTPTGLSMHMPQVGSLAFHGIEAERFACDITPVDDRMAELIELSLDEHAQEFLQQQGLPVERLQLHWQARPRRPQAHRFQRVTVCAVHDLTPHLRRVHLAVPVIQPFAGDGLHVRLLLPRAGEPVAWPGLDAGGRLQWPAGQLPLPQRIYTIRHSDAAQGWIELDIVRHTHDAPGAQWITRVQPGDVVGLLGPPGGSLPQAEHLVLIADLTALPAAARMAEMQSRRGGTVQLHALLEHAEDAAYLPAAPHVHVHIGDASAFSRQARATLSALPVPGGPSCAVWVAGHQSLMQGLRAWLRQQPLPHLAPPKLAVYWS